MKLLNESITDLLKEIEQDADDARFMKPGTSGINGETDPEKFCDECKALGYCKNAKMKLVNGRIVPK